MKHDEIDRSLIDAAREGLGPSASDRARLRRSVRAAIAGGAAIGTAAATTSASAAAKGIGVWALAKTVVLGVSALAIVAGATYGVMRASDDDGERVASAAPEHARARGPERGHERAITHEPPAEPATQPAPAIEAATEPAITIEASSPAPAGDEAVTQRSAPPRAPHAVAAAPTPSAHDTRAVAREAEPTSAAEPLPTVARAEPVAIERASEPAPHLALGAPSVREALAAETSLLRDAHRALRAHDPARALALLDQHAARFPSGVLAEERSATHVLALCDAGRSDAARAEAARFLAAHPRSMHAARVRASECASPLE